MSDNFLIYELEKSSDFALKKEKKQKQLSFAESNNKSI